MKILMYYCPVDDLRNLIISSIYKVCLILWTPSEFIVHSNILLDVPSHRTVFNLGLIKEPLDLLCLKIKMAWNKGKKVAICLKLCWFYIYNM